MRICKYCKKSISDNDAWNPDSEGNGYHHACLCEMEFRSRDRQIYDKGRADVLDKLRAEINEYGSLWVEYKIIGHTDRAIEITVENVLKQAKQQVLEIIDKYRQEG